MKKKIILISLTVILILSAGIYGIASMKSRYAYEPQQNLSPTIEIPETGIVPLNEITDIEKPTVTLFYTDWCTFCRRFMPEYGKISKKYSKKYNFSIVNCDNPEYSKTIEKFHILGFPSLFIIDKKLNHNFMLNIASTADTKVFEEELDNYHKSRSEIIKKF